MRTEELTNIKPCVDCGTTQRVSTCTRSPQTNEICERCATLREIVETESGSIQEYDRMSRWLRVANGWRWVVMMMEQFDVQFQRRSRRRFEDQA